MGIYQQGILGAFVNKVGSVVGSTWKGRPVMRVYQPNVANPKTPAQVLQRQKFNIISSALSNVTAAVAVGWRLVAALRSITPRNAGMAYNIRHAITVSSGSASLNFDNFLVSSGRQLNVSSPSVALGSNHSVAFSWTDNSGYDPSAISSDVVICVLLNTAKDAGVVNLLSATREDGTLSMNYPASWAGDTVHAYIFTRDLENTMVSTSIHAGSVTAT